MSLIVLASLAMGVRSAAIRELQIPGLSTTYLTGTLTVMVGDLVQPGRSSANLRRSLPILLAGQQRTARGRGVRHFRAVRQWWGNSVCARV